MEIVAFLELGDGDTNPFEVLVDTTVEDLFLQRPIESFGNTIGLRFGDEGKAGRDAPELDLVEEVVSGILRAVVHAQGQSASRVGAGSAKHRLEALRNRLPAEVDIWAGGSNPGLGRRQIAGVTVLEDLDSVAPALADWRATRRPG